MKPKDFFTTEEKQRIVEAIRKAEKNTSGEIRVHLESNKKKKPAMQRAWEVFNMIGMHKTHLKNGVLFYIDVNQRVFSVLGDKGINNVVPDDFWDTINKKMLAGFSKGQYADALITGILQVGEQLKKYFPYQDDDKNELPDEISIND